jgi:hypothetical protein
MPLSESAVGYATIAVTGFDPGSAAIRWGTPRKTASSGKRKRLMEHLRADEMEGTDQCAV